LYNQRPFVILRSGRAERQKKEEVRKMVAHNKDDSLGKRAVLLLAAPFVGLIYVIALPFVFIATVSALVGKKVVGAIFNLMGNLVTFGWRPDEAYLGGKKKKERKKGDSPNVRH
jgi:hypothetical protein